MSTNSTRDGAIATIIIVDLRNLIMHTNGTRNGTIATIIVVDIQHLC